jgi:Acetyltransferase (GNAT) family
VGRLVGQLSASARAPTEEELREVIDSPATRPLVARDEDDNIVGSLTLALFRIPTGLRAWIEDVVVDEAARGQGGRRSRWRRCGWPGAPVRGPST